MASQALIAIKQWTFLLGPGRMSAVNALCLGSAMYRSRLVRRLIRARGRESSRAVPDALAASCGSGEDAPVEVQTG